MACEAAEVALSRSGIDGEDLAAVFSASVSDPFAEHGVAAHVAYRFGATGDVRTDDFRGTPRAATDALLAADEFVSVRGGAALVVGVDVIPTEAGADGEAEAGAGAGAAVLGPDAERPAARVASSGSGTTGFVERHRRHGEPPVTGDEKFERTRGVPDAAGRAIEARFRELFTDGKRPIDSFKFAVPRGERE